MDSLVHNRGWMHVAGVLAAVVLLGASCSRNETPPASPQPTSDAGTTTMPTEWTEYRNPKFGVAIPYPKGWYVEASDERGRVEFFRTAPPPLSDAPASMWFERESGSIRNALDGLNLVNEEPATKNGRIITRAEFVEDFYDPNPRVLLYLWERDGQTLQLGGPDRQIVEYAIDRVEVLP